MDPDRAYHPLRGGGEGPGPGDRLFVLTGAGVSAESGLPTFRGAAGLWEGHRFEEVATPEAFARDPETVWRFYSWRREQALGKGPGPAHAALARLGEALGDAMFLCTQNVDSLHEAAGSPRVVHMHGRLFQSRCSRPGCPSQPFADEERYPSREAIPRCCDCGALIRPDVCWFGEVPFHLDEIGAALLACTVCLVAGTSGMVEPAASFVRWVRARGARTHYVGIEAPANADAFDSIRLGPAGAALGDLVEAWTGAGSGYRGL
jgi:NAD-dependent deacetylase